MTDWKAVGVGFVVMLVVGAGGLAIPIFGQIGAGLIGGFATGYLAGGSLGNGAWNGLVAGSISGIVVSLFAALLGGVIGLAGGPLGSIFGGLGLFALGVVLTLVFAIDSAIAGAVGAWVKG